ncbi:hypothetical protein PSEUBRA_001681 [Kalmanozyma brasiliensis GHG001]|uniref:Uncharacterized protein n=1 Tax=Kalmanozyma brasiliensis (strain GHG001) TaxID=1365824 RepID=V5GRR9_KALBG|nr:uncharacterized protein PSEUBRA_001681 [Kalmanozyma brasiliensis GHG001]EST08607.1 hypothetical protein PSEUBRA_001681 [Kalmanozyma brasiliensis GHG001]
MVSLTYSAPAPSDNDPVFIRTHFLGRVASDASGLDYQHELLKRRSSRHSELNRWSANWLAPVTSTLNYDSDESSDTDDDAFDYDSQSASNSFSSAYHARSRSSTLPFTDAWSFPAESIRARSMTAPSIASSSTTHEAPTLHRSRSNIGSETRLMPARPLSIDTAQPLRLPSLNVSTLPSSSSASIEVPSPIATVGPSPKTCSPPVVRIECSESDGSCHGDAGDQDPEAQLAAGIIRLREQRRHSCSPKASRRTISKRRSSMQLPRSVSQAQPKLFGDVDSDQAQSDIIRSYGGNFVLRLAEMALDFGSSALERLVASSSDNSSDERASPAQLSPLEPRRRSSTTPQELNAEAGELLRRRRERNSKLASEDKATLTRSWSVPKLLSLPLFSPSASLRALSATTASTPTTPTGAPTHLRPNFGFTSISHKTSKYDEPKSFDDVATTFSRQSATLHTQLPSAGNTSPEAPAVSPLWRQ